MEHTFEALGLRAALVTALAEQGITTPTEIQQKMIPEILSGKDVIGRSETGSGKTLAYLLPIFEKLDMNLSLIHICKADTGIRNRKGSRRAGRGGEKCRRGGSGSGGKGKRKCEAAGNRICKISGALRHGCRFSG